MVQRTARRTAQHQVRTRALGIENDDQTQLLSALGKFADAATNESVRRMRAEVETSKAIGASRAAQDLLVAEQNRQGVTEDDNRATQLAYNNIVGQSATVKAGNEFIQWYESNPDADDKAIEGKKRELYQPLFETYGGDPESAKQISLQVQESQFNLMPIQAKIKQQHKDFKSKEAINLSIDTLLQDPNADASYLVSSEIPARAEALGMNEMEWKKSLLSQMKTRAAEGDGRLLEALEQTDWAKGSEFLRTARSSYDNKRALDDSAALAKTMADNETRFLSGDMTEAAFLNFAGTLSAEYGGKVYSRDAVKSLLMQRKRQVQKQDDDAVTVARYRDSVNAGQRIPLGVSSEFTSDEKNVITDAKEVMWADMFRKMVDSGKYTEDEANNEVLQDKVRWAAEEQIVLPDLKDQLSSLVSFDPKIASQSDGLRNRWEAQSDLLLATPPSMLEQYLGSDADYALAIKDNLRTMQPYDAFNTAYNAKYRPSTLTPKARKDLGNELRSQLNDKMRAGIFARNLLGQPSAPVEQVDAIFDQLNTRALGMAKAGIKDVGKISEYVMDEFSSKYEQVPNGTFINMKSDSLAGKLVAGTDTRISPQQAIDYVDTWMTQYATVKGNWSGEPIDKNDLVIEFNSDGSSFVVKDKYGYTMDSGYLTTQMFEVARPQDLEATRKTLEQSYTERKQPTKELEAYERHGFFY